MKTYLISALLLINAFGFSQDSVFNAGYSQIEKGRVFLSRDQGDTWQRADNGLPEDASVNAWALSGKRVLAATEGHGIYISDDGLKNWLPSNKGLPHDLKVNALINHKNLLYAGSFLLGVFVSLDDGDSWKPLSKGLANLSIRCFYSQENKLIVGTDDGIYTAGEDGVWSKAIQGFQINSFTSADNVLFAATNFGVLRSVDAGRTWSLVWSKGAIFSLETYGSNTVSFISQNQYYTSNADANWASWVILDKNFTHQTFRITPNSGALLIEKWRNTFKSLRSNQPFRSDGLPAKTPFKEIIVTPYGILVAIGWAGC